MSRRLLTALWVLTLSLVVSGRVHAAHLGMGLRVGEVTQHSAILWTRITRDAQRNWNGFREPKKREPKQNDYVPSPVKVEDREGAMPGASGQVRVIYGTNQNLSDALSRESRGNRRMKF